MEVAVDENDLPEYTPLARCEESDSDDLPPYTPLNCAAKDEGSTDTSLSLSTQLSSQPRSCLGKTSRQKKLRQQRPAAELERETLAKGLQEKKDAIAALLNAVRLVNARLPGLREEHMELFTEIDRLRRTTQLKMQLQELGTEQEKLAGEAEKETESAESDAPSRAVQLAHSLLSDFQFFSQASTRLRAYEQPSHRSRWWYVLPLFLGLSFGLLARKITHKLR